MIAEVSLSDPQHIVSHFAEGMSPPSDIADLPKPQFLACDPRTLKILFTVAVEPQRKEAQPTVKLILTTEVK